MAVSPNTSPILIHQVGILGVPVVLTNQITNFDGTGTTPLTIYDPAVHGQGNGALVESIRIMPRNTSASINVASALRIFCQNSLVTPARWDFFASIDLPAMNSANHATLVTAGYPKEVLLPPLLAPVPRDSTNMLRGLRLPAEGVIWGVSLETAIAAGVTVFLLGGEY